MNDLNGLRDAIANSPDSIWTLSKPLRFSQWPPEMSRQFSCPVLPRRMTIRRQRHQIRVECFTERQSFTSWWKGAPVELFDQLWNVGYGDMLVQTPELDYHVLRSARDPKRYTLKRKKPSKSVWLNIIADDTPQHQMSDEDRYRFHEAFDMLTHEGRLRSGMADKARQVDRLVDRALVLDVIRHAQPGSPLRIVDAGCGKAYLSIALALTLQHRGIKVHLVGIDANDHVVQEAQRIAGRLGLPHAQFLCTTIAAAPRDAADLVIALHACDTASDDAIRFALACNAKAMLIAPCCHKAIQQQLRAENVPEAIRPLLRDGIQRERLGDLVTDAIRREFIRGHGYDVGLEEFVPLEHSGKNVLICAQRKQVTRHPSTDATKALCVQWGVHSPLLNEP